MNEYCPSLTRYERFETRCVMVGDVGVGGNNPIRIQSMTTTDTMNTDKTIAQSIRMIKAGCEIVRITAPSVNEAKNLKPILDGIRSRGYRTPLVADIHFTPNAAEVAATIVEKVRINPGNYADRKKFQVHEYSDSSYLEELERIRARFTPLVKICKENGTAMRIGTNHGSLSDRILSRYGDTPLGMVESALEFIRIAEDESYHDMILSMKASNTQVVVQAYRLLVNKMIEEGMNYPLHLGVTEAGEAEDGRIKSALGIGALLEDGLGDTIRVSLTEEPEAEIPVAKVIAERYNSKKPHENNLEEINSLPYDPFFYNRRTTRQLTNIGSDNVPRVIGDLSKNRSIKYEDLGQFGYLYSPEHDKWHVSDLAIDILYIGSNSIDFELPGTINVIHDHSNIKKNDRYYALYTNEDIGSIPPNDISFLICKDIDNIFPEILSLKKCIIVLETDNSNGYRSQRKFFVECLNNKIDNPIIIKRRYRELPKDKLMLNSAIDLGALQIDGLGDGIWLSSEHEHSIVNEIAFGILQASRTRISKTEYISCPSCGRTLFDLQETTAKIRARTDHLKGIKIGVMGCIVNGPGEMADADYGYVGTGPGLISLYKGQQVIKKNVNANEAVDALIQLIDSHGDWVEPTNV